MSFIRASSVFPNFRNHFVIFLLTSNLAKLIWWFATKIGAETLSEIFPLYAEWFHSVIQNHSPWSPSSVWFSTLCKSLSTGFMNLFSKSRKHSTEKKKQIEPNFEDICLWKTDWWRYTVWGAIDQGSESTTVQEIPCGTAQCTATTRRQHMPKRDNIIAALLFFVFNLAICLVAVDLLRFAVTTRLSI